MRTLLVHSRIENDEVGTSQLKNLLTQQAELLRPGSAKKDAASVMREALNTVGTPGGLGQNVRCVVSVAMLTEGWDTKTVTHVIGYRAFSTQLLCEQVTGRALRRTTYDDFDEDGKLTPQYAEVVGIPFDFASHSTEETGGIDPPETYEVKSIDSRRLTHGMLLPRVVGYSYSLPTLDIEVDTNKLDELMKPQGVTTTATLEGITGEGTTISTGTNSRRLKAAAVNLASQALNQVVSQYMLGMLDGQDEEDARLVVMKKLYPKVFRPLYAWLSDPANGRGEGENYLLEWLDTDAAVSAVVSSIKPTESDGQDIYARFDHANPLITTENKRFESSLTNHYPADRTKQTKKSPLNLAVCDSRLETAIAQILDSHEHVNSWVRNFRLDWSIPWYDTAKRRWANYVPDFVVRIGGGHEDDHAVHLIVEGKGQITDESKTKKKYAEEKWIPAVEASGDRLGRQQHWNFVEITDQQTLTETSDTPKNILTKAINEAYKRSEQIRQKNHQP